MRTETINIYKFALGEIHEPIFNLSGLDYIEKEEAITRMVKEAGI
jgi:hypothetical protein